MIDVIVIGGGIAGISAAARLSWLGRVALLEQEEALGYHASGRSAALFEENYGLPSTVALNRASADHHAHANGGVLSPRGLMLLAKDGEEDRFAADVTQMHLEEMSVDDARGRVPVIKDDITRVAYDPHAWDIDTDRLIQNFASELRQHGGQILTRAEVTQIARVRQGWQVTTPRHGVMAGRILVNAAGAWADRIAQMARIAPVGLQPLRRSMGRVPAPDGHDVTEWPMIFGPGESWYAKPDAGALIVSPADEDPSEPIDAWADDMVLAEGFARMEGYLDVPVTRLLSSWAGLRTFAPDRQLVIGPATDEPTFFWCAGQGGYGFQSSPAYSQLLADLVAGRPPDVGYHIAQAVSPARFDAK